MSPAMHGRPAFEDEALIEKLQELVMIGPFTAYTMISALQLAWRHPAMSAVQRQVIEDVARPMQAWFSGILAESLEAGWDVSQDRDPGEVTW